MRLQWCPVHVREAPLVEPDPVREDHRADAVTGTPHHVDDEHLVSRFRHDAFPAAYAAGRAATCRVAARVMTVNPVATYIHRSVAVSLPLSTPCNQPVAKTASAIRWMGSHIRRTNRPASAAVPPTTSPRYKLSVPTPTATGR